MRLALIGIALAFSSPRSALAGYVMTNSNIHSARDAWVSNSAAAEATYGHISTWETGGVTDMDYLFCGDDADIAVDMGCNKKARWFNDDISAWDTSGVTTMFWMFRYASAFDQDLGWCVADDVDLRWTFDDSRCESTNCGVYQRAGGCAPTPTPTSAVPTATLAPTVTPLVADVMTNSSIRTAVAAWLSNPTAAERTYGHISTWETGGVTDMSKLFCADNECYCSSSNDNCWCNDCNTAAKSFNDDIGAWDTSGVTTMFAIFYGASAFNSDIGDWAVDSVTDMSYMFRGAKAFDQDIGGWAVHSVTDMRYMFRGAKAFDQDLGWCVDNGVDLDYTIDNTPCASTYCGIFVSKPDAQGITHTCPGAVTGYAMDDSNIRTAAGKWIRNAAAAEATYGHISTWETGEVTDMNYLFGANYWGPSVSFNDDISAWDTSSVTTMEDMFAHSTFNRPIGGWSIEAVTSMKDMFSGASAFDQDLGWCVENDAILTHAFEDTKCESTLCGVAQKDVLGICEPFSRPCLIGKANYSQCELNSPSLAIFIVLALLAGFGACVCCRKKKDETYFAAARRVLYSCLCCCCLCCRKKKDPIIVNSWPISPAESPREDPDEYALETRAAALFATKAVAVETVERPGFTRKLSSFLFGEQEEASKRTEPDPAAPKFEEMYNQIAAWYKQPENAALRARWGAYPDPEEFQTWPGFVRVTNAFLDAAVLEGEAVTSPASNVVVDAEPVSPGISFWGQFH